MKSRLFITLVMVVAFVTSCNHQNLTTTMEEGSQISVETKSLMQKSPKLHVYVETNDVNPLIAMDYKINGKQIIDVVELFAANIHKQSVNGFDEPVLYLNDKLTPLLENGAYDTYVWPMQEQGMKVLLTLLGDWQHIGLANMNEKQQKMFVNELIYAYNVYFLDGFGFDDEYADYDLLHPINFTSYSGIINKLREKCPEMLLSVFDWGHTETISTSAKTKVNYFYHGNFTSWNENPADISKSKWAPACWNMSYDRNSTIDMETYAELAKNGGYGSLMFFNLRCRNEQGIIDPLSCFQAVSNGAYNGATVTCDNDCRPRPAAVPGGHSITHATALAYLVENNIPHFDIQ